MKAKLGVVFLVLAVLISFLVFNYKNLGLSADSNKTVQRKALTKEDVTSLVKGSEWFDYTGKSRKLDLSSLAEGKRVYIHLWASWCGPCLNEIPELLSYAQKNKSVTQFILVSLDESQEELEKFLKSFPEMNDAILVRIWDKDKKMAKSLDADRLPMTVILQPDNSEVKSIKSVVDWKNI